MRLTPCGLIEEEERRDGRQKPKKIHPWLSGGKTVRRSAHRRKRCACCNKIYYHSTKSCPVCGSNDYKLRSH